MALVLVIGAVMLTLAVADDLQAMLALTRDWNPKDPSWNSQTPICKWMGVTCDVNSRVMGFAWNAWNYRGVAGTLNMTQLPPGMQYLLLDGNNQFTGTPNLSSLPSGLYLYLGFNQFCGDTGTNLDCSHIGLPADTTCTPNSVPQYTSTVTFPPCGGI